MTARMKGRKRRVVAVLRRVAAWAAKRPDIVAVVLVGSYARGRPGMGSDVDLVVVTTDPGRYLER